MDLSGKVGSLALVVILVVVAIVLVSIFAKKILKFVAVVAVLVGCLVFFKVLTTEQLTDAGKFITSSENRDKIESLVLSSDNLQSISSGNGIKDVKVKVNGEWISVSDIDKVVSVNGNTCTFTVEGKEFSVTDENVSKLLGLLNY